MQPVAALELGQGSCHYSDDGGDGCWRAAGPIGNSSCLGENACAFTYSAIGSNSCVGGYACDNAGGLIGNNSCNGTLACSGSFGTIVDESASDIGDKSCNGNEACYGSEKAIGNNSCNGEFACISSTAEIGDNACNASSFQFYDANNDWNYYGGCSCPHPMKDGTSAVPTGECNAFDGLTVGPCCAPTCTNDKDCMKMYGIDNGERHKHLGYNKCDDNSRCTYDPDYVPAPILGGGAGHGRPQRHVRRQRRRGMFLRPLASYEGRNGRGLW